METHVLFNRDFNFSVFPALIHVLDDQCNPLDVALTLTSMHTGDDRHQERFQVDFAVVIGLKSEKFVTDQVLLKSVLQQLDVSIRDRLLVFEDLVCD